MELQQEQSTMDIGIGGTRCVIRRKSEELIVQHFLRTSTARSNASNERSLADHEIYVSASYYESKCKEYD